MTYLEKLIAIEKRNKKIFSLREKGWTYEKIGKKFGIKRQRVFAIIKEKSELSAGESK